MAVEFEASASIGLAIGDKLDGIQRLLSKEEPKPNYLTIARSEYAPANGSYRFDFGAPPANKVWNVVGAFAWVNDVNTDALNAKLTLYTASDVGNVSPGQAFANINPFPHSATFTKGVFWAMPNQHIIGEIWTDVSSVPLGANIIVAEWNAKDKW